jgi:hypothetical protein
MPTNDGFDPDHALPSFLSGHADEQDEYEQWSPSGLELLSSSSPLKAGILAMGVMVGGIAIALSLGNPGKLFADAMAALPDSSAAQRAAEQLRPPIQSAVDALTSAPNAGGAPARSDIAAADEPANEPGTLLRQFQGWAAWQDAQAQAQAEAQQADAQQAEADARQAAAEAQRRAQPVQAFAAQIEDDSPAPEQPTRKHRKVRSAQNARAEVRHVQKPRARDLQQNAAGQAQPVQDARAQEQPAAAPSFLQSLGMHQ